MNCEQRGLEIADQRAMTHSAGYPPSLRSRRSRRCGACEGSASRITRDGSLHRASSSLLQAISLKASNRATLERMLEDAYKSIGGGGVYCYWLNAAQ